MRKHVAAMVIMAFVGVIAAFPAAAQAVYGFVGVVGPRAVNMPLPACGGMYAPDLPGVFHATLPCGNTVTVQNPQQGGAPITARVIGRLQSHKSGQRVADVTPALAEALGLEATSRLPHLLWVAEGNSMPAAKPPPFLGKALPPLSPEDTKILADNMYFEAADGGLAGMMAVAQITTNLTQLCVEGRCTVRAVVYHPWEFSWTMLKKEPRYGSEAAEAQAKNMAGRFLLGLLSGDELAATYLVGPQATQYYAHRLIGPPKWALQATGTYCWVPMEREAEDAFGHRFFRSTAYGPCTAEVDDPRPTKHASGKELYAGKLKGQKATRFAGRGHHKKPVMAMAKSGGKKATRMASAGGKGKKVALASKGGKKKYASAAGKRGTKTRMASR